MNQIRSIKERLEGFRIRVLHHIARHIPGSKFRVIFHKWRGVKIGKNVFIGLDVHIDDSSPQNVIIENGVFITAGTLILVHQRNLNNYAKDSWVGDCDFITRPVHLKKGAHIGVRSVIMPGVTIGKGAIVGAGSLVTKDVPDYCLALGSPARVIKEY